MSLQPPKSLFQVCRTGGPVPEIPNATTEEAYVERHDMPLGAPVALARHQGLLAIKGWSQRLVEAPGFEVWPATRLIARILFSEKFLGETRKDPVRTRKVIPLDWLADLSPEECTQEALMIVANQKMERVVDQSATIVELFKHYDVNHKRVRRAEVRLARDSSGAAVTYAAVRLSDILPDVIEEWKPVQTQFELGKEVQEDLNGAQNHHNETGHTLAPSQLILPYQNPVVYINQRMPAGTRHKFMAAQAEARALAA